MSLSRFTAPTVTFIAWRWPCLRARRACLIPLCGSVGLPNSKKGAGFSGPGRLFAGTAGTGRHCCGHTRRFALGRRHCLGDADPLWQHERADEAVYRHHGWPLAQRELEDKATGIFTSTGTIHGGQETTILTALVPLIHLGMVFVGTPYGQNPQILVTDGIGGSPYGPSTLAGTDGSRQPVEAELTTARNLGSRLARVAGGLKHLRAGRDPRHSPQARS